MVAQVLIDHPNLQCDDHRVFTLKSTGPEAAPQLAAAAVAAQPTPDAPQATPDAAAGETGQKRHRGDGAQAAQSDCVVTDDASPKGKRARDPSDVP